jgi:uncharacterized coiled-coil protein SlyX
MKPAKNEARMSNEARLAVVETTILNINSTLLDLKQDMKRGFDRIDTKFEAVDKKFEAMDRKFDTRFDRLENRLWSNFFWLMGMIIGLAGLIAHTQHWI